jgi:hypothetical protein
MEKRDQLSNGSPNAARPLKEPPRPLKEPPIASQIEHRPMIAPFQPPMVDPSALQSSQPADSWFRRTREYLVEHWQVVAGVSVIVILLLVAVGLMLWNPE